MINKIITFLKKRYKLVIILFIAAILSGFFILKSQTDQPEQTFEHPQYRDLTKTLEISGHVDAKRKAQLRFLAGGKIVYLGAQEGDWVDQWQTIATIDQRDLQKRLEKKLNLYMQQRWDWENLQDDIEDQILDTQEQRYVDQQQWDLDDAVLDVEIQDIAISQSVMSAPFTGILVQQPTNIPHVQVTVSDIFKIVDPESLIFKAEVNEEDIAKIKTGQAGNIILDAYLDEKITSHVDYIAYTSSQTAGGNVFIIEMPIASNNNQENQGSSINTAQQTRTNLLDKYRLGMNGDVLLELENKSNVLTIPLMATIVRDDQTFVKVQTKEGVIEEKKIEVGLETSEYVEVISGLKETDLVLIPSI